MTTVYLVDDHEVVRRGIRDLLQSDAELQVAGEASTVAQALTEIAAIKPNVAILDVQLPDGNGVSLCRDIRSQFPDTVCLVLTSFSDDEALFSALIAGASGYLLKQIAGMDLVQSVRRAAAGESLLDPAVTTKVLERYRTSGAKGTSLDQLSDQERKVFLLIGEGKTNRQIGEAMFLAEKTIKNYVSNLLAKLGMERRTQAAAYAARLSERRQYFG